MKKIILTGKRFGKLLVVKENEKSGYWDCVCDCGNTKTVYGSNLRSNKSTSCGCCKQFKDITNQRFGRLVAIKCVSRDKAARWLCKCDCGNEKVILGTSLRNGSTKSCGCINRENARQNGLNSATHHETKTRLYGVWLGIKRRLYNPHTKKYPIYGGRGITMCDEWKNDFVKFRTWAMENGYDPNAPYGKCTIDRIDVNGNYEPSNCRWVDLKVQANNRRKENILHGKSTRN